MQSQQEARCSAETFEYEVGWITWQGDISLNGWFAIKKVVEDDGGTLL